MPEFDPATASYVSLVTYRKTGIEVRTPVWIAPCNGKHYVFSEASAGKVKRLRNNSSVKLAQCDARGKILDETWLEGSAIITTDPAVIEAAYASFTKKYGMLMRLTNFFSKLTGRYDQRAMLEITLA